MRWCASLECNDTEVRLRRIRERGRKEEAGISNAFLEGLGAYYRTFPQVAAGKYKLDVLTLDVSALDIRTSEGRQQFLDRVSGFLQR
jgi:deoxyadenosine/deoxycytidine kinase